MDPNSDNGSEEFNGIKIIEKEEAGTLFINDISKGIYLSKLKIVHINSSLSSFFILLSISKLQLRSELSGNFIYKNCWIRNIAGKS
ncbi:hypothetical protein QWZ06_19540 [Chryseobacterium tructae]|uniref:Uncharacterized protein n=1 Tax=Chryseobacterium tructae TaxID=1037380 RepID=A0ABV7Y3H4_9FLAO|nr:hypothetical protein [Chryseobacterium tructae]MDN3694317.1 hypothetical protein [Chryseobacterium tructae]